MQAGRATTTWLWLPGWVAESEFARRVLGPFICQRALLFLLVTFGSGILPPGKGWNALPTQPLLNPWLRWDSAFFLVIAASGYGAGPWGDPAPFFPLFPGLVTLYALVLPLPIAALVVANLAALAAMALLYELAKQIAGETVASRAVWLALIFPASFFLSAGYSESVYLLAALGTILAWLRGYPKLAAIGVLAATLARPTGVFCLSLPFLLGWLIRSRRWSTLPWFTLAAGGGGLLVLLVHFLASGDPFAFLHSKVSLPLGGVWRSAVNVSTFEGEAYTPWFWEILLDEGIGANLMRRLINWAAIGLAVAVSVHWLRRRDWELGAFVFLSLAVPLAFHGSLLDATSMTRYALGAFPIFITLARWAPDGLRARGLDAGFVMLQAVLAVLFSSWYWAE